VELEEKRGARVSTLSGGQKQRLSVACALVSRPELLFLDEPTTGLDPQSRRQLWEIIRRFKDDGGTVLLTTHYMEEAERLCDRVAIVDHGRVVASGTLDELLGGHAVRIRVTGLKPSERASLTGFGDLDDDGEWLTVRGLDPERVPELVAEVVRLGGRVYQVEPRHQTLEDRFLQLLGAR